MRKPCFTLCLFSCFTLCLFSRCFMVFELCLVSFILYCSHRIMLLCWTCFYPYAIVLYWLHVRMIICFAIWSLWSFPYDCFSIWSSCSYVSHHVYLIAIYLLHYTCPFITCFILVLLLLALLWGSNVFCASVSGYKYICSKFITVSRFRCEWVLSLFPNSSLNLEFDMGVFVTE